MNDPFLWTPKRFRLFFSRDFRCGWCLPSRAIVARLGYDPWRSLTAMTASLLSVAILKSDSSAKNAQVSYLSDFAISCIEFCLMDTAAGGKLCQSSYVLLPLANAIMQWVSSPSNTTGRLMKSNQFSQRLGPGDSYWFRSYFSYFSPW